MGGWDGTAHTLQYNNYLLPHKLQIIGLSDYFVLVLPIQEMPGLQ